MAAPVDIGTLIVSTPGTLGGRPRIAGTRIGVATVAILWKQGYTAEQVATEVFGGLGLGEVHAALAYYFANRLLVDSQIAADDAEHDRGAREDPADGEWQSPLRKSQHAEGA